MSTTAVRFGRVGTKGQTKRKDFDSEEQARAAADKLILSKKKKGYRDAHVTDSRMQKLWCRLESWFAENLSSISLSLRPPATESQIEAAETELGIGFPGGFRQSLTVHDGQGDEPTVFWLPSGLRLGSLQAIVDCWRNDAKLIDGAEIDQEAFDDLDKEKRVRQIHFHPRRIPIAGSVYWDYDRLLLDFIPGPNGTSGQLIARVAAKFEFVCSSFDSFLEQYVEGLELGRIIPSGPIYDDVTEMRYVTPRSKKSIHHSKYFR